MKSLSDYTSEQQTELFKSTGAFFAFSQQQFQRNEKEGITYVALGGGLIAPKDKVKMLVDGIASISRNGIALDLKENGKQAIIRRELRNFECFYIGDVSDCVEALADYGITKKEIEEEYKRMLPHEDL